jgi:hypothetical protein
MASEMQAAFQDPPRTLPNSWLLLFLCTFLLPFTALAGVSVPRTGILVHGCHLQADAWEEVVFGSIEKQQLGRAAKAALLTHQESPACVVFGSGGSEKNGKLEVSVPDYLFRVLFVTSHGLSMSPSFKPSFDGVTGPVHAGLFAKTFQRTGTLPRISWNRARRVSRCPMLLAEGYCSCMYQGSSMNASF